MPSWDIVLTIGVMIWGIETISTDCTPKEPDVVKSRVVMELLHEERGGSLYKYTIDDSTVVLIYKGQSCSMIQLKP